MSKLSVSDADVKYPERESAVAFLSEDGKPFSSAVIGITYPNSGYRVERSGEEKITVFEYVTEGRGELVTEQGRVRVKAGDTYVLRAGERHVYYSDKADPWKKLWVNYDADYISPMLDAFGIGTGVYSGCDTKELFEELQMLSGAERGRQNLPFYIADCINRLVLSIASHKDAECDDGFRIQQILKASVYEKLTVDSLAERVNMSKSNLIRTFKSYSGVTPYEYLLRLKMSAAKLLLRDTKMTVREISERLSICDEHYFSSVFSARVGATPTEYRKNENGKWKIENENRE